jgi:alpha-tubulin suppressor-like RCC1 family protein
MKPGIRERRLVRRCGAVALIGLVAAVAAPTASAEQAGSKQKRLPMSFIDAGGDYTCAKLKTGAVRCWGRGANGRLGYGNLNDVGDNELPSSVGTVNLGVGRRALVIVTSSGHTCAILDTRAVRCWGFGNSGRLGYGDSDDIGDNELPSSVGPVDLGVGRTARAIANGGLHTCAILDNGNVRCWGFGGQGQLGYGNGNSIGDTETPGSVGTVPLGAGRKAVAITLGNSHTCALLDNGRVRCWGEGSAGQLGYGNTDDIGDNELPTSVGPVALGRRAVAISAGDFHNCALLDNGQVRCWGVNSGGRLGYGNTDWIGDDETPASVGPVALGAGRRAVAISAGGVHTCALLDNGNVRCWGRNLEGQLGYGNMTAIGDDETPAGFGPVNLGAGRTAVAISAGGDHTCALLDTGAVRCWGNGLNGRLGYGNTTTIGDNELPSTVGTVSIGGLIATKLRPTLSLALSRRRDRVGPFTFRASGKLRGFLVDSATCSGKVVVKAKQGKKSVVRRPALKLGTGGCTYVASLKVKDAGRWKVTAKFAGNGSLKARSSAAHSFRAG